MWREQGLEVLAGGTATASELGGQGQRAASFYADPVAWLVVDAVRDALGALNGSGAAVRDGGAAVGVLSVSELCTLHTMRLMAGGIRRGRLSPLRFAGANPGAIAGLACIVFGFRGPSLVLSMPPVTARPVTALVARSWLEGGGCHYVVANEHEQRADGTHVVRSAVLISQTA